MVSIVVPNLLNGFAGGFIFVPLTTMTMGALRKDEIGNAAGIYNLMRNLGGSIGIASVTTFLMRGSQIHQNYLVQHITPGSTVAVNMLRGLEMKFHLGGADIFTAHQKVTGMLYQTLQQQASLLAYADNFTFLGYLSLLCIPLAMLFHSVRKHSLAIRDVSGE
jgi:DHA2 family multidrug resistance protein